MQQLLASVTVFIVLLYLIQLVQSRSFRSASTVYIHVIFGLLRLHLPSGVEVRTTRQLLYFSLLETRHAHLHRLAFTVYDIGLSLALSKSLRLEVV